ncbi:(2Fe-2S) ferredoxin domain-containing protein [Flavobacterium rakeshii]|uniref:(2Fe-2S) ferredoxin domain-containing protein n=1 Tax=Flavobacterium rakeshii TaxID=1038845 RepID=UPI002E7AFD58|nr:(2Fe-2S) ferredoxin domain-containing protein [Flavobacterium rakeshii]MEE1900202.1 (2Fe-2S) ferredoxin domain-containing protein [Flavobacterium rakeshii]
MKKIDAPEKVIFMCDGKKCGRYNKSLRKCFKEELKEAGLKKDVDIVRMECTDNCKQAPVMCLQPQNVWLAEVNEKGVKEIVNQYFIKE